MIPDRYAPTTYALFRIVFGFLFLCFGLQKVFGLLGGTQAPLMSLQGAAGVVETVCGLLIMLGLFTRPAAFLACGEMAVAFWYIHAHVIATSPGKDVLAPGVPTLYNLLPHNNGGVDSVAFCFAFLYIASRGAGQWGFDALKSGGRR